MAKSNEKAAGQNKTESQRGKSRFASQSRPGRVVLPSRPPREVDNEIVSILLGGDPTALAPQGEYEILKSSPAPTPPVASLELEVSIPVEQSLPLIDEERRETLPETHAPKPIKQITPPAKDRLDERSLKAAFQPNENLRLPETPINSFKDFSDRWKHGLRKGQLKICEVLYQKTYALGNTECLTSFAELGRLSGLKMRQCFNVVAQLEALKFIERVKSQSTSNKKDQGSLIRFYLFPKN